MTLDQFNTLTLQSQWEHLFLHGQRLLWRMEPKKIVVCLYQVSDFLVEVHYGVLKSEILRIKPFIDAESLEPYLEQISLKELKLDHGS